MDINRYEGGRFIISAHFVKISKPQLSSLAEQYFSAEQFTSGWNLWHIPRFLENTYELFNGAYLIFLVRCLQDIPMAALFPSLRIHGEIT
jgi:hypothetical protein